ncbi:MAG: DNA-3-methyladenine glycosylase I [Actinomycetota bacterium]|nr:DNA-3-methyladenine glycosylase I [Actinomycetota bacterium]
MAPPAKSRPDLITGEDGRARCAWGAPNAASRAYHDEEWGHPSTDARYVLEIVCLEGFQAGLSWQTILNKRAAFRRAFCDFEARRLARFGESDVARLLDDAGIVRHRAKIEATIANAKAALALERAGNSLAALIWRFAPSPSNAPKRLADLPAATPASRACSAALRAAGFCFVGPTTLYAAMQALGLINDHLAGCSARAGAEAARAVFRPPH